MSVRMEMINSRLARSVMLGRDSPSAEGWQLAAHAGQDQWRLVTGRRAGSNAPSLLAIEGFE
jgi:hypothetical protein